MPTASISVICIDQGAENAATAAKQRRLLRLVRQRVRGRVGQEVERRPPEWKSSTISASGSRWRVT